METGPVSAKSPIRQIGGAGDRTWDPIGTKSVVYTGKWMDGWVDGGSIDGWMDGWVDGWVHGWVGG